MLEAQLSALKGSEKQDMTKFLEKELLQKLLVDVSNFICTEGEVSDAAEQVLNKGCRHSER